MKSLTTRILLAGAILIAGTTAAFSQRMICSQEPQPSCPDVGITSVITGGDLLPPPHNFTFRTQGASTFNILEGDINCCGTILSPANWSTTIFDPILGPVTWEFDTDPTLPACQPSTIFPNQADACLPATGNLFFWIRGTVAGRQVRSGACIHLQNVNITSCNPFRCERFDLVNRGIPFFDVNTGEWVFNLDNLTVVLDN